eukprot:6202447-Pleurochrysis_carterae.AAC.8
MSPKSMLSLFWVSRRASSTHSAVNNPAGPWTLLILAVVPGWGESSGCEFQTLWQIYLGPAHEKFLVTSRLQCLFPCVPGVIIKHAANGNRRASLKLTHSGTQRLTLAGSHALCVPSEGGVYVRVRAARIDGFRPTPSAR